MKINADAKLFLNELLKHLNTNSNSLAAVIKLKRTQNLYDIENAKVQKISPKLADKIISAFPNISKVWLLTGEGDMLKKRNTGIENRVSKEDDDGGLVMNEDDPNEGRGALKKEAASGQNTALEAILNLSKSNKDLAEAHLALVRILEEKYSSKDDLSKKISG